MVLFSEIFQLTAPVGRMAALLAGNGYVVCVPEIFHELLPAGTVLGYDQAGADVGNRNKVSKRVEAYDEDARVALDHLATREDCDGTLLTMGVCIGGHLAFRCALDERVRAAACFYATDLHQASLGLGGDDSLARAAEIQGELLMVWGRQDPHIPPAGRRHASSPPRARGCRCCSGCRRPGWRRNDPSIHSSATCSMACLPVRGPWKAGCCPGRCRRAWMAATTLTSSPGAIFPSRPPSLAST